MERAHLLIEEAERLGEPPEIRCCSFGSLRLLDCELVGFNGENLIATSHSFWRWPKNRERPFRSWWDTAS